MINSSTHYMEKYVPFGDPFAPTTVTPIAPSQPMVFRDASEPDAQARIEQALSAAPPKPEMADHVADNEVQLPGGVLISGNLVRTAYVRELHGGDEEDLARAASSHRPERLLNTLLMAGVERIGSTPVTEGLLDRMLVGDRDALVLGIRLQTFGKTVEFERYTCAGCAATFSLHVDLADIPVVEAATPGETSIIVELKGGRAAKVRHATGSDQLALMAVSREKGSTLAEQDTLLLSRVVLALKSHDGDWVEVSANPAHVREALGMADRRAIMRTMNRERPGPRMDEVAVTCPDCGHGDTVTLTVGALFLS